MRGSGEFAVLSGQRVFLFPDAGVKEKFFKNAEAYADVDLARQGNCLVCLTMAGKELPGSKEHFSIYKGLRYLFPSDREKTMFDADPIRFATGTKTGIQGAQGDVKSLKVTMAVSGMV